MNNQHREVLASMKDNQFGEALRSHLTELYIELGDVEKCENWEDTLGRKHAKAFLKKAFSFLDKPNTKQGKRNEYE